MGAHPRYPRDVRRLALTAMIFASCLLARAAPAQPGTLERSACTGAHTEDHHLLPCLAGDAGPLGPEERALVRARLSAAASARWDRIEQLLWWMFTLADSGDRALVLDLLVAHGLPRGAADAVAAMGDPAGALSRLIRRAPRRDRAALRALAPRDCRLVTASASATEVTIECNQFVECGPGACTETHLVLRFVAGSAGPRLLDAGRVEQPSGGGCGCCLEEF